MIDEIAKVLRNDDNFLVVTHINPDGDALGCLLGAFLALSEMGKKSWPFCEDNFPEMYDFLPGHTLVLTDPALVRPRPNWILSIDVADEHRISGDITSFRETAGLINIDHHPTNPGFGRLNLIDPLATSSAEVLFRVLKLVGYAPSAEVGKCLYTGLISDTGGFRFQGVNERTLAVGAELLATGFDSYEITRHLYEEESLSRRLLECLMLERMEILLDGKLIVSTLYSVDFDKLGADRSETENLVNRLREVRGVEAGVLITELHNGMTRVSFRSKDRLDVAALARSLGGGGHRNAAGLRTPLPPSTIRDKIVEAVAQALRRAPSRHLENPL